MTPCDTTPIPGGHAIVCRRAPPPAAVGETEAILADIRHTQHGAKR